MIYRKNILLAIVELFGGDISATDFQKLLFIFSDNQVKRTFDFVPYKYGCFSFQSMADKNNLIKEGYLKNTKNWVLSTVNNNFIKDLDKNDRKELEILKKKFRRFSTKDLVRYVYLNYPYFAINSEIASKHLSEKELHIVKRFNPTDKEENLFTIGYEGKSLEQYLNILIQKNIKILCDVRKNPLSRKYGFSKNTLQNACESVNIKYIHLPELGINSDKRKNLISQKDYDNLFLEYKKTIIPYNKEAIKYIFDLVKNYNRVALTCYEAISSQCHRTMVANAVLKFDETISIKHI